MKNSEWPKISIVTPSFNQGCYIEQTIQSILDQSYPNLEYIIIDGGSTDNSVEIIKKYEKHLKYWVSEKDKGQANAINKGLQHCTGKIFNWLNSDDYLEQRSLYAIAKAFEDDTINSVAGKVNNFSLTAKEIVKNQNLSAEGLMCWESGVNFVQPGVWLRREGVLLCEGIDEQFHYAFDWDMLIRYLCLFPKVFYLDDVLVNFRLHEESKTMSLIDKFAEEERSIIEKLVTLKEFEILHKKGKDKIQRTRWVKFLQEIAADKGRRKFERLRSIFSNINKQPFSWSASRITLGTLRKILFS